MNQRKMNYDRRNKAQKEQYELLQKCLYSCNGEDKNCIQYQPLNNICVWYRIVRKDVEKIKSNNKEFVSFPILEKILKNEKM